MKQRNGLSAALITAVTVAAVVLGGALAARQRPHAEAVADAAPLAATATATTPTKLTVAVTKLSQGRLPQIPYLTGREVRGGAGDSVRIPGTDDILEVARVDSSVLALVTNGNGTQLLRLDANGVGSIANVNHLEAAADQTGAAYAALGGSLPPVEGGTIYADSGTELKSVRLTTGWNFRVLAYADGKVYFQSSDVLGSGATWSTYVWSPGSTKTSLVKTIPNLTKLTADGRTAASTLLVNDSGSCSGISAVATGLRAWKTCDYTLDGFSPSGTTVFGSTADTDGYCAPAKAALDAKTGRLIHEWKACFATSAAEDDEHLLMVAIASGAGQADAKSAIVRCTIRTGACELATPVLPGELLLAS